MLSSGNSDFISEYSAIYLVGLHSWKNICEHA